MRPSLGSGNTCCIRVVTTSEGLLISMYKGFVILNSVAGEGDRMKKDLCDPPRPNKAIRKFRI